MNLRPTQEEILKYSGGRMAISAVPGSGKTFTLTRLAAQLIADGRVDPTGNQQVLVVTYLNASVENFRARINAHLQTIGLNAPTSYAVRTLHGLGLDIVRFAEGAGDRPGQELLVLDEAQSTRFLNLAIDNWREMYPDLWQMFMVDDSPQGQVRWRRVVEDTARSFIRTAKNERYRPEQITEQLKAQATELLEDERGGYYWLNLMSGVYANYQAIITRQGALDFNDLIARAADLVENRPDLAQVLRQRWPYVLEDEAQDSVPLQEILLGKLTGENGNWVRVGDPNQAITTTFTAADPHFFNQFLDQTGVLSLPLPHSGRCAPKIIAAANELVHWVCDEHPVPEVRAHAFRRQEILTTPPGDTQPNPPDEQADIRIKVYAHREDEEIPQIAKLAYIYTQKRPEQTVAVLVPTHDVGHKIAEQLDRLNANYDNLLKGGTREREIAAALYALLSLLGNPLNPLILRDAHKALYDIHHPAAQEIPEKEIDRLHTILRSVFRPETFLYPLSEEQIRNALPAGVVQEADLRHLARFVQFMQRIFPLRVLPIDDLVIALSDELFAYSDAELNETDLAIAYQIANALRRWYDLEPTWRLPQLTEQLAEVANGRRTLKVTASEEDGYEPKPGRITLTTQHGAKGLEWDGVFLVGIDGYWIPGDLNATFQGVNEMLGGDPTAEMTQRLFALMNADDSKRVYTGLSPTQSAHVDVICERLRLLYVGITRARRFLHLSRSKVTRQGVKERDAQPASALAVLYQVSQKK